MTFSPVGDWRSPDGTVHLRLRTDGTYAAQVAGRRRKAQGTYAVDGATMTLSDVSGLCTPVALLGDELEMAGYRLSRP
nr:Atu4866 domain-containing protein [uncultured Actinoplanes sp.]